MEGKSSVSAYRLYKITEIRSFNFDTMLHGHAAISGAGTMGHGGARAPPILRMAGHGGHRRQRLITAVQWYANSTADCRTEIKFYLEIRTSVQEKAIGRYSQWNCDPFLRASAMLKNVIDIGWTSVCPSVCPSVRHTLVLYQNGWTYCHAFFATR